jgi:hypothetical protein
MDSLRHKAEAANGEKIACTVGNTNFVRVRSARLMINFLVSSCTAPHFFLPSPVPIPSKYSYGSGKCVIVLTAAVQKGICSMNADYDYKAGQVYLEDTLDIMRNKLE